MPNTRISRIRLFSTGLLLNAVISTGDSSAATTPTATRKISMRIR